MLNCLYIIWTGCFSQAASQGKNLNMTDREERIAWLTRQSPDPPDGSTFFYALIAVAIALVIVWIWNRRRGKKGWTLRSVAASLVAASFLWFPVFVFTGLISPLFEQPTSYTRELVSESPADAFETFLRGVRTRLPEDEGVFLVNCQNPRLTDTVNYFLYPRKVIFKKQSLVYTANPAAALTPEILAYLESIGAKWMLDISREAIGKGPASALIEIRSP